VVDYATLLRDHLTLKIQSIDRIFLQAYVPKLQSVGRVCIFLRWQGGFASPRRQRSERLYSSTARTSSASRRNRTS
jgi:hypothetical protein